MPSGYRQGLITSITVFLAFSLAFIRYWGFEMPGEWTWGGRFVAAFVLASIGLQVYVLFRALDIKDEDPNRYAVTVRWFLLSVGLLATGVVVGMII